MSIQFDHQGTLLLEQYSTLNRGRKFAIFTQFGDKLKESRWLAAPIISRRITDGLLMFTPDATREEAEQIARGLNREYIDAEGRAVSHVTDETTNRALWKHYRTVMTEA